MMKHYETLCGCAQLNLPSNLRKLRYAVVEPLNDSKLLTDVENNYGSKQISVAYHFFALLSLTIAVKPLSQRQFERLIARF